MPQPNDPSPDLPPELAHHPKYLILRELGRGGMGIVYQARHKEMGRQIVIKVINRALLEQPDIRERFRREIHIAAQLSHPNIVSAYDAEQAGELYVLVMEFVAGQSLAEILEKKGPLPVDKACHYIRQAASGLHHAHKRKMVHRDIKPSNLMLTPQGKIKILDFGLAKIISESNSRTSLTPSETYIGTPEYSAPEQAADMRTADIRADLYSLGCTLYFLLAGRPPFCEASAIKTILAHQQEPPQPLTELRPDVPERLWRVIARLLAKEPIQRYQKPKEVVLALAPFIKPSSKGGATPAPDVDSPIPTKIEVASFADRKEQIYAPNEDEAFDDDAMPPQPGGWKSPGLLAGAFGVSLALILMASIIIFVLWPREIIIQVNKPNPDDVFVDGQRVPVSWDESGKKGTIHVRLGTHEVEVKKEGFKADPKIMKVEALENRPVFIQLQPSRQSPQIARGQGQNIRNSGSEPVVQDPDEKRKRRWHFRFNIRDNHHFVDQLFRLDTILAVPVEESANGAKYKIIRDLSNRPAKLLNEDIGGFQHLVHFKEDNPDTAGDVMTVLRLNLKPSHFVVYFPERLDEEFLRLEIEYLNRETPGRKEEDIDKTTFKFNLKNGKYVPEVIEQELK